MPRLARGLNDRVIEPPKVTVALECQRAGERPDEPRWRGVASGAPLRPRGGNSPIKSPFAL